MRKAVELGPRSLALSAMEIDGTIIYDTDPAMIDRSALNGTAGLAGHPGLAKRITATRSGAGSYHGANASITTSIAWQTVALHGTG